MTKEPRLSKASTFFSKPYKGEQGIDLPFSRFFEIQTLYANGFKKAADRVTEWVESSTDESYKGDYFFPIAYLYRHYLELQLKNIANLAGRLGYLPDHQHKGHKLNDLWEKVHGVVAITQPVDAAEIEGLAAIVDEIHRVDESGQEFRYPANLDGSETLQKAPQQVSIVHMKRTMDAAFTILEDIYVDLIGEFEGHIPSRKV